MTGVIDYGAGNLFSLIGGIKAAGGEAKVTSDTRELAACDEIILPGVGAFRPAMERLEAMKLDKFIRDYAHGGGRLLGICLGMQLLFERSFEFGETKGLGLIGGDVLPLRSDETVRRLGLKVPHIGWNSLKIVKDHPLTADIADGDFVYYVHSFFAPVGEYATATSEYGATVCGIAAAGTVAGCQFHPEKSGEAGLKILGAFVTKRKQITAQTR